MLNFNSQLNSKKFAVYGIGETGKSIIRFFKKRKIYHIDAWDDNFKVRKKNNIKISKKFFIQKLKIADFIFVSPGINIINEFGFQFYKRIKHKIYTDIDLFYLSKSNFKSIVVTGTNGKSTTCKIIDHVLRYNKFKTVLCGNIGQPILNKKIKKDTIVIIEASSFQLFYSKILRANISLLLNFSKDHLDWHKNIKNYRDAKFNIFSNQKKNDKALLQDQSLINIFKKKKLKSKLIKIYYNLLDKKQIKNNYLKTSINLQNLSFAFQVSKIFKITKTKFYKSLLNFRGLEHRQENFLKKRNINFINDSKATSFEASKSALESLNNIYWILGGQPKIQEYPNFKKIKKNIRRVYLIGNHINFFKKKLSKKINYKISKTLKNSIKDILGDIKKDQSNEINNILFSPASASFDQYKNFEERGKHFKNLSRIYAKKFL